MYILCTGEHISVYSKNQVLFLQVIGSEISTLSVSEVRQALFVFDSMSCLPDSEALLRMMKSYYIHIIVLFKSCDSTDKLVKEIDRKLIRGCTILKVEPLSLIHSTQRIVHSFMKDHDFTPSNDDQQVFEKLAEFTAGSPLIVDIASQVVHACFEYEKKPIQFLTGLLDLDTTSQATRRSQTIPTSQSLTRSISGIVHEVVDDVHNDPQDVWTTNVEYDSWSSILTLIDACELSSEERLLLNCLSVFSCSPIPLSMITELASVITKSAQKSHLAGTLHCKLVKYKLIHTYPHPVVLHSSVLNNSSQQVVNSNFVHVPLHLSQCIWKSLENVDQIAVYTLIHCALTALHQTTLSRSERQFCCALCSLLLESMESNFALVGKECYQEIYSLFLNIFMIT